MLPNVMWREFEKPLWFNGCDEAQVLPARQYKLHEPRARVLMIQHGTLLKLNMLLRVQRSDLQQEPACSTHLTEDQVRGLFSRVLQNRGWVNVDNVVFRQRSILPGISTQRHMEEKSCRQALAQTIEIVATRRYRNLVSIAESLQLLSHLPRLLHGSSIYEIFPAPLFTAD